MHEFMRTCTPYREARAEEVKRRRMELDEQQAKKKVRTCTEIENTSSLARDYNAVYALSCTLLADGSREEDAKNICCGSQTGNVPLVCVCERVCVSVCVCVCVCV